MFAKSSMLARFPALSRAIACSAPKAPILKVHGKPRALNLVARCDNGSRLRSCRMFSSASDSELSAVLSKELEFEKEEYKAKTVPEFLSEFKNKNIFSIRDCPGENEVVLTREFGNEKITVTFSIDDISNAEPLEQGDEHDPQNEVGGLGETFPISVVITVTKNKASDVGAITFQTVADSGNFQVTSVTYNNDSELATADTAEADYKRRGTYVGPIFDELDDSLSGAFYQYLEERGIDSELAEFIPEYIEWKEQQEYTRWLGNVKAFVDHRK